MWFVIEGEQYGSQRKIHAQCCVKKSGRVVGEEVAVVGQGPVEGASGGIYLTPIKSQIYLTKLWFVDLGILICAV